MRAAVLTDGPVYFRITRLTLGDLFDVGYEFEWGRAQRLAEGSDVSLVGTGMMTGLCLEAAEILAREQIWADVLHCGSVKPIDNDLIVASARKTGVVVTAENASILGGLGSAVAEVLCERAPARLRRIGVCDRYILSGDIPELMADHRMRPVDIAAAAREAIAARDADR